MGIYKVLLMFWQFFSCALAANACLRDSCYNAVIGRGNGPNLASRRADCISILRTVVDDNAVTVTRTTFSIGASATITTTMIVSTDTQTSTTSQLPGKRSNDVEGFMELEVRDQIIIKGQKPSYARACKENSDYGR